MKEPRMFLFLFFLNAASASIPNHCEYIVQHPVTKIFHLANSSCFEHVKKDIDSFCTKHRGFDKPILDDLFVIAFGSSGVVYECSNKTGTPKAVFQHCRTPTGVVSTHCYDGYYYNKTEPLLEFNNREICVIQKEDFQLLKVGQISSDGEIECRGDGKSKARKVLLGCNTKIGFMKNLLRGIFLDYCKGSRSCRFIKPDGMLLFRCNPANTDKEDWTFAKEHFLGCVSKKILDPISTPFIYRNGELMKEYGQKCSPDLKINVTGKEKFCTLNGLQYEMGTWLRILISSNDGHLYYCDSDKGKPKNIFRGCFTKSSKSLLVTMINSTATITNKSEELKLRCTGKAIKHDFDKPLFDEIID